MSARQMSEKACVFFWLAGAAILFSAAVMHPWVGRLWRGNIMNFRDAMAEYAMWAGALGAALICGGFIARRPGAAWLRRPMMLCVALSIIVLPDRLLLAKYGRRLFVPDPENRFAYRPNAVRTWGAAYGNKTIRINRYGYRDDDFPLLKPQNEFRVVVLGDSVTMGHGVNDDETFCSRLERMTWEDDRTAGSVRIINAGVQGYATAQEINVLRRCLAFEPDAVVVGFCMNDVTEPFVTDRRLGGVGMDYHGMGETTSRLWAYVWSETGYGRWAQKLRFSAGRAAMAWREEVFNVGYMAAHTRDDPRIVEAWRKALDDLDRLHALALQDGRNALLVVFPFAFQLSNPELRRPQELLLEHAKARGIRTLDLIPVFETKLAEAGHAADAKLYFMDEDHLSVEGHIVVAQALRPFVAEWMAASAGEPPSPDRAGKDM